MRQVKKMNILNILYAVVVVYFANLGGLSTAYLSKDIISGVMLAAFLGLPILLLLQGRGRLLKSYKSIYIYYILFFLLTLNNSGWSIFSVIRFLCILLFGIYILQSRKTIEYTINLLYFTYVIYGMFTFIEFFNRGFYLSYIYPLFQDVNGLLSNAFQFGYMAGITGHYSSNATFLTCGVLISSTRYLADKEKKNLWMSLFLLSALLLTGKRAHIIFIILALYTIYYFSLTGQKISSKLMKSIGIVIISLCFVTIIINYIPALSVVISRIQTFMEGNDTSTQVRFKLWALALNAFKQHPVLGIGWEQFYSTLSYMVGSNRNFEVHNVYLQLLCETGLLGFSIYISWFIFVLGNAIKVYKKMIMYDASSRDMYLIGFALSLQIFFLLYCFTGNPLYDWKTNIPYFLSCSIVFYFRRIIKQYSYSYDSKNV